jgi:8-oxo-dGTP diphosphatase
MVSFPPIQSLMGWAIRLFVPRHRAGVILICLDDQQRVLLLRHVFHPKAPWGPPGGWLERYESPADCILRELEEETGLDADLGPVVHISYESSPDQLAVAFLGKLKPGPMRLSSEIIEAKWFHIDALPQPQYPFVQRAIVAAIDEYRRRQMLERESNE